MRPLRVVLGVVTLASSVLIGMAVSAGTATADTYGKLPITSFGDLVVDPVHKRVFVSDPSSGKIVATDYQGKVVKELAGLPGVQGLTLSADSNRLYAAVSGARALVAVATATVTEATRYPVGDSVYPGEVVAAGGRVWFGYDKSDTSDDVGDFGSVDLATSDVYLHDDAADLADFPYNGPPRLVVSPARPGLLVAADMNSTGAQIGVYDISKGTARRTGRYQPTSGLITSDLAFTADGSELITVDYHGRWSIDVDKLAGTEIYTGSQSTYAMAASRDGRIAVAADVSPAPKIQIYAQGAAKPTQEIVLPKVEGAIPSSAFNRHGLAWEPGGNRLFTVLDGFWLLVLNDPSTTLPTSPPPSRPPTPAIRMSSPSFEYARPGIPFKLTGTATALPAGAALTVTRTNSEAPAGKVIATVDGGGAFSFTDVLTVEGSATYTVRYPGTGNWDALSGELTIWAYKLPTTISLNKNGSVHAYGSTVTFTAWLRKWDTSRVVEIWADPAGDDQPKRLLKKGAVDNAGKFSASLRLTRNTTLTARYAGDAVYGASVGSATVYTRVAVSTKITKHFKTKKIGSLTYYVVRTTKDPDFTTTMTAYPGRYHRLAVQRYSGGKWKSFTATLLPLDSRGKSVAGFTGNYPAGTKFRVRAEYNVTAYSDKVNATTYGAWQYYTYAK